MKDFFVSTDKRRLDVPFIFQELTHTYFGSWRSLATVQTSIDNSLCFGLYESSPGTDKQVGFARVVTDYATFAWICDVVITRDKRRIGLGTYLMEEVMAHPEVKPRACLLSTHDAHDLYAKFGFKFFTAMKKVPSKTGE